MLQTPKNIRLARNVLHHVKVSRRGYASNEKVSADGSERETNHLQVFEFQSDEKTWPRKIVSGVQPTGILHFGNYFGAIQPWVDIQNRGEDAAYFIADLHSMTLPYVSILCSVFLEGRTSNIRPPPSPVRTECRRTAGEHFSYGCIAVGVRHRSRKVESIFAVIGAAARRTVLDTGLSDDDGAPRPFAAIQREVGHCQRCANGTVHLSDTASGRLSHLQVSVCRNRFTRKKICPKMKIQIRCRATHVPCGDDQRQQLQLAQHLAKVFNTKFGTTFPILETIIADDPSARIKSLRDPSKKQSKSDPDEKGRLTLRDTPDQLFRKIKRAITDFTSEVTYEPEKRPGVANLITIHALTTNSTPAEVCKRAEGLDTGQ